MNTKVNKLIKIGAAALFLIALAINVKVTLEDPFAMLSEDVIAQTTSSSSSSSSSSPFAYQSGKRTKNVSCIKEISVSATGGSSKFGYRDKCKKKGTGCTPTACM